MHIQHYLCGNSFSPYMPQCFRLSTVNIVCVKSLTESSTHLETPIKCRIEYLKFPLCSCILVNHAYHARPSTRQCVLCSVSSFSTLFVFRMRAQMARRIQTIIIIITVAHFSCNEMKIQNTLRTGSFNNSGWEFGANNILPHAFIFCFCQTYSLNMEREIVSLLVFRTIFGTFSSFTLVWRDNTLWKFETHTSGRCLVALIGDLGIRSVANENFPAHSSEFEFDTCRRDIDSSKYKPEARFHCWQPLVFRFGIYPVAKMRYEVENARSEKAKRDQLTWTSTIFVIFFSFFVRATMNDCHNQ